MYHLWFQATEWFHAPIQPQQGTAPEGQLLLEETQGWKNNSRRSYEVESSGIRGNYIVFVPIFNSVLATGNFCRLLKTFANSMDPD